MSSEWDPMELEPLVDQMEHNQRMDLVVYAMSLMSLDTIRDVCEQVLTKDDFEQLVHGWFRGWLTGLGEGSIQR